jgi:hypothetical protein
MTLPQDLCNRALDAISVPIQIGSFTDGTVESETCRRIYGPSLRQLLRTAHWAFARKMAPLQLLGDATQVTLDVNGNPLPSLVEPPWTYAYAWPIDGVRARWLPWNNSPPLNPTQNIVVTPPGFAMNGAFLATPTPARFLVATSEQFPVVAGEVDWPDLPDTSSTEGVGLTGRRIVLTDVTQAQLVYTKLVLEIEQWDDLFTEAMVAVLGLRLAMPLIQDKKLAMAVRHEQVALAQNAIREARVANANDSGFPQSVDHTPDWIRARRIGGGMRGWGWGSDGPGYTYLGWEGFAFGGGGGVF